MDLHRAGSHHLGFTSLVVGILAGSASNPLTVNGLSAHSTDSGLFKVLFLKVVRTRGNFSRLGREVRVPFLQNQFIVSSSVSKCCFCQEEVLQYPPVTYYPVGLYVYQAAVSKTAQDAPTAPSTSRIHQAGGDDGAG